MRRIVMMLALLMVAGPARADLTPGDVKKALDAAKVTLLQAVESARKEVPAGKVVKVKIDQKSGRYLYSIRLIVADSVKSARIDALTGALIDVEDLTMTPDRKAEVALVTPLLAAAKSDFLGAAAAAAARIPGARVFQLEVDVDHGELVYEVQMLEGITPIEVDVSATTGAVAKITRQGEPGPPKTPALDFDKDAVGKLPEGWNADGTNQVGPVATWQVAADPTAPSPPNALALIAAAHGSGNTFNICWTDRIPFHDGAIEVALRPESGAEDQGGGPIWRVKDRNNYYICRANPLESNFRLYSVKDGTRKQLASAQLEIPANAWHTIRVEHRAAHITCYLDGQKLLEADDTTLPDPGGIGLWTKADAVTSFDNLKVTPGEVK